MVRSWGAFVIKADRNVAGQSPWPPISPDRTLLSFTADSTTGPITDAASRAEHSCGFWDRLAGQHVGAWPG